jgi:hypothetical protein
VLSAAGGSGVGVGGAAAGGCAAVAGGAGVGWTGGAFCSGRRGRRRRRHAELALQGGKLAVAYIDQAMRGGELRFQILDAILERLCLRVGGVRITASGRAAARAGRHQAQMSVRCAAAGAAPRIHLTVHFADRFALIQGGNLIRAGETQHGTAAQYVDISTECIGIRPVYRHHGLIDVGGGRGTRIGAQTARNLGKGVALGHAVATAADGGCRLRCAAGGRCAGGRRGRRCGSGAPGGRRRGARRRRGTAGWGSGYGGRCAHGGGAARGLARRVHRRIEQHGVFTHQTAARPIHLDQKRHERLGDGVRGMHQQGVVSVFALAYLEGQRGQELRTIDAVTCESFPVGQARAQGGQFIRGGRDQVDFGIHGLVESRLQMDLTQPQRPRRGRPQKGSG